MTRATFRIPEPVEQTDAIPFVLTAKERSHAAWASVHLEKMRREANKREQGRAEECE